MRLWNKDLIKVLPRQQLLGQWRELKLIAKDIKEKGTTNHILINMVMCYDLDHFCSYASRIYDELKRRGYKVKEDVFSYIISVKPNYRIIPIGTLYYNWHNKEYLEICYYNLKEKYLCDGITVDEWKKIEILFKGEI